MPSHFITLFFFAIAFATLTSSVPIVARDVYIPHITKPHAKTVWECGRKATVTWDHTNIPNQVTNREGMVLLRDLNGLEDVDHPLASGFDVVNFTSVSFKVPHVPSGTTYRIVLFGDSGNFSPEFAISCDNYPA